jgi:hypothetical protein
VHEVERAGGQVVAFEVVATNLEEVAGQGLDVRRVEIDGQHRAVGGNLLGHPRRDGAAARAGFQATPTRADPERAQKRARPPIPRRFDARQPLGLVVLESVFRYRLS